jgi:hypothetical protein
VSGLDDPLDRGASAKNPALLAPALQSRPTALFFGAGPARSAPKFPRAFATPETSFRPIKPSCGAPRLEWTSSRVQHPGSSCMRVVEFLRTTVPSRAMKPRYAAALALVVWYLIRPPLPHLNAHATHTDTAAPLSRWIVVKLPSPSYSRTQSSSARSPTRPAAPTASC